MKFFYHLIFWSTVALVMGPLTFVSYLAYQLSKVPDMHEVSFTFESITSQENHEHTN